MALRLNEGLDAAAQNLENMVCSRGRSEEGDFTDCVAMACIEARQLAMNPYAMLESVVTLLILDIDLTPRRRHEYQRMKRETGETILVLLTLDHAFDAEHRERFQRASIKEDPVCCVVPVLILLFVPSQDFTRKACCVWSGR